MDTNRIYIGPYLQILTGIFFFLVGIAIGQDFITTDNFEDKINGGLIINPSFFSIISPPMDFRLSQIALIRSDSLTLSSCAPSMIVGLLACVAKTAIMGISSIKNLFIKRFVC